MADQKNSGYTRLLIAAFFLAGALSTFAQDSTYTITDSCNKAYARVAVKDSTGAPESEIQAVVFVRRESGRKIEAFRESENIFSIPELPCGTYDIYLPASKYPAQFYNPAQNTSQPEYGVWIGDTDTLYLDIYMTMAISFDGSISGYIQDSTMLPASGTAVELYSPSDLTAPQFTSTTDSLGWFTFARLPEPSYYLKIPATGGYPDQWFTHNGNTGSPSSTISSSTYGEIYVELAPNPPMATSVIYFVMRDENGSPYYGTEHIELHNNFKGIYYGTEKLYNKDTLEARNLLPGNYEVAIYSSYPTQFWHANANTSRPDTSLPVAESDTMVIPVTMNPNPQHMVTIMGSLFDSLSGPASSMTLSLCDVKDPSRTIYTALSDREGNYVFPDINETEYYLKIEGAGYPTQWWCQNYSSPSTAPFCPFWVHDSMHNYIYLTQAPVAANGYLSCVLTDEKGIAVSNVNNIQLRSTDNSGLYKDGASVSEGKYEFANLPQGEYQIEICADYYPCQYYDPKGNTSEPDYFFNLSGTDSMTLEIVITPAPIFKGAIKGHLESDPNDGSIISGATISLYSPADTTQPAFTSSTDSTGRFVFDNLPEREYFIKVSPYGQYPEQWLGYNNSSTQEAVTPVYADPYTDSWYTLSLNPSVGPMLTVTVKDSAGEQLYAHDVFLYEEGTGQTYHGMQSYSKSTGESNMTFFFEDIPQGTYALHVASDRYPPQFYNPSGNTPEPSYVFPVSPDSAVVIEMYLTYDKTQPIAPSYGGAISGMVTDKSTGTGIPYAYVGVVYGEKDMDFNPSEYGAMFSAKTDSTGSYTIGGIEAGSYFVYALTPGKNYVPQFYQAVDNSRNARILTIVDSNKIENIDFILRQGAILAGRVSMKDGTPAAEAGVSLHGHDINIWRNTVTDSQGRYVFRGLLSGTYSLNARGNGYFPSTDTIFPEYTLTEGDSIEAGGLMVEAGGILRGMVTMQTTSNDPSGYGMPFRIYLYPDSSQDDGKMLWPREMLHARTESGGYYNADMTRPGDWRMVFVPYQSHTITETTTTSNTNFIQGNGWSLAQTATGLSQSPLFTVSSRDTTMINVAFRKGYSVFGSVSTEDGAYVSTRDLNQQIGFHCNVFVKENDSYYLISEGHMRSDGKFEIPGLIDGKDYYISAGADGYPHQFWSPTGANNTEPKEPYHFSTTSFIPLKIVLESNPEGYYPHHYEPVSIHSFVDSLNQFWVEMQIDRSLDLDSLTLFSTDESGVVSKVYSTVLDSSRSKFKWRETRNSYSVQYRYIALAYGPEASYRSSILYYDLQNSRTVPDDSLWLDVSGRPFGIQITWGAGKSYEPLETDTILIYRRPAGATNWNELHRRVAWDQWLDDHEWDDRNDSGVTYQYKAGLLYKGTIARWSPVISFTISDQFIDQLARGEELLVGPNRRYTTIQEAINAAEDYDRIIVEQGEYIENLSIGTKKIELNGMWNDNKPPIINGNGGTGISIDFTAGSGQDWYERCRIFGFKFKNCAVAVKTGSEVEISQCLFAGGSGVVVDIDSAAMTAAVKSDPFAPAEIHANLWACTFIGKSTTDKAITLTAKGPAVSNDSLPSDQFMGPISTVPPMIMRSNAHIGNSIFSGYGPSTPFQLHQATFLHMHNADFWPSNSKLAVENIELSGTIVSVDPQFIDTTFYLLSATSPLKSSASNGEPMGYDSWHHEGPPAYYNDAPGPVENFTAGMASLDAVALTWSPPAGSTSIAFYAVYRVDGNPDLWYVRNDSEWDMKQGMDQEPDPIGTTTKTSFIDSTVTPGAKYIYAVAAIDADSNHGEIRLPYPPPLENYIVEVGYGACSKIQSIPLKGKQWHMIGPWGLGSITPPVSENRHIYRWDDTKTPDKLYDQYISSSTMKSGKGYWFFSETDTTLNITKAFYDSLAQQRGGVQIELKHGESGWNQISSPYPFPVAPDWLQSFQPNAWVGGTEGYTGDVRYLKPWQAVWVYTPRDTVLTIEGKAYIPTMQPLAKTKKQTFWEVQVSLAGPSTKDQNNYLGVLPPHLAKSTTAHRMEPPPAFGYPNVYFVKCGDAAQAALNPEERLARHYKASAEIPNGKLEWMVGMSPSDKETSLKFDGLTQVPDPVLVFWVTNDTAINLRETDEITMPPHDNSRYGYVVATANPLDIALYTGKFHLRKNFPNPFGNITTLEYVVPYAWNNNGSKAAGEFRDLSLKVYDIKGRCVATLTEGKVKVGIHRTVWNGTSSFGKNVATGFYIGRLMTKGFHKTIKMMKVK
ncbi:MAG: hypothetical protein GF401_11970 [Chitinivibrionales bacterium]|nr:hypothetical protein [Chitinivibrionales bacterium]